MARHGPRARAVAIALRRRREPDPVPWWMWALLALGLMLAGTAHAEVAPPRAGEGSRPSPAATAHAGADGLRRDAQAVLPPSSSAPTIPPGAGGSGTAPAPRPRTETPFPRGADSSVRTDGTTPSPDPGILAEPPATGAAGAESGSGAYKSPHAPRG